MMREWARDVGTRAGEIRKAAIVSNGAKADLYSYSGLP